MYPGGEVAGVGRDDTICAESFGDGRDRMAQDISAGDTMFRPRVHRFAGFRHGFDPLIALAYDDRQLERGSYEGMRRCHDRKIRMEVRPDRIRVRVDVNQGLRRRRLSREPKSQGRQITEPSSDRNDQVRSLKEPDMGWRHEEAKMPNPKPVIVWVLILHLGSDCDRHIPVLAQCDQILAKFRSAALSSDQ